MTANYRPLGKRQTGKLTVCENVAKNDIHRRPRLYWVGQFYWFSYLLQFAGGSEHPPVK